VRELCAAQGFYEVHNYSFISEEMAARFGFAADAHLRVLTNQRRAVADAPEPAAGIHRHILENAKRFDDFRLFEIGYEIHKDDATGGAAHEVAHLMAAVYSKSGDGAPALFELKRLAECSCPAASRPGRSEPL